MTASSAMEVIVRRAANRLGIDIQRHRPGASEVGRLSTMLASHGVNLVFDIGANVGQFAHALRNAGYQERIVSFEPLSTAREQLVKASRGDVSWAVAPCAAIGSEDGEVDLNIAGNSVSSSILEMLDSHVSAAPASIYVGGERVPLRRLDTLAPDYLRQNSVPFLKIDTQGYEDRVLSGATSVLETTAGLQMELSLVPLYKGQQLFRTFMDKLDAKGFDLWAISPGFADPRNGRILQIDATFFHR